MAQGSPNPRKETEDGVVGRGPARAATFCNTFVFAMQHGWEHAGAGKKITRNNTLTALKRRNGRQWYRESRIRVHRLAITPAAIAVQRLGNDPRRIFSMALHAVAKARAMSAIEQAGCRTCAAFVIMSGHLIVQSRPSMRGSMNGALDLVEHRACAHVMRATSVVEAPSRALA
ncbi:MAG: hypothetical protein IPK78_04795 [Rhodospirillales bacterium]|nr:hypothetical protein [Rhodospirillales bacterium]